MLFGLFFIIAVIMAIVTVALYNKYDSCGEKHYIAMSIVAGGLALTCWLMFVVDYSTNGAITDLLMGHTVEKDEDEQISSESTTTAPEPTPSITTINIDGKTYAMIDDKLYEIVN